MFYWVLSKTFYSLYGSPRKKIYGGRKYMIFLKPGKKYMTSGNKIYDFSTARKKIYGQWEKNICFFDTQEKNI